MEQAYGLRKKYNPDLLLGGVAIPERHAFKRNEHLRVANKASEGCSFFVTQCVYNVQAAKDFLSDYYFHSQAAEVAMVPVLFTLTPCGSQKTLEFMRWLGIGVPRWLENELMHSSSILEQSLKACVRIFAELDDFARDKRIPIGCNVESVAVRKEEIDASVELVADLQAFSRRG
jgi:5,10-methylenetetrahydrofolate reductase